MKIMPETACKIKILSNGVLFTNNALKYALSQNAKIQNLVYNKPDGSDNSRPQELKIRSIDGYETVVSCVVPRNRTPIVIDYLDNKLVAIEDEEILKDIYISFVEEPDYYKKKLSNGEMVKKYVSSCGLDELNIFPWKGCAISKGCLFCGVNTVAKKENADDLFTAFNIGKKGVWDKCKNNYLNSLEEAILIAKTDKCFNEHLHLILISGDLSNEELDIQSKIYSEIAKRIYPLISDKATEGIVSVMMPPNNFELISLLKQSHIDKIVFNLEVGNEPYFSKYCPGKADIGLDHINKALIKAVDIFGKGNVWSNFVFGLEPLDLILKVCETLASQGIVPSANVLHIDSGNRLDCDVPLEQDIAIFFATVASIYRKYGFKPYYCSKALRTSLTNEAYEGRIIL